MKVATGKRHPSDSRLHAKSRSRDRRRPGIREAHSQANTARPGSRGGSQGAEPSRAHATGGGLVFARHTAKRIPQGREPRGFSGGRAPLLSRRPHRATA